MNYHVAAMKAFAIDSYVRVHHISTTNWSPTIGEELLCQREEGNRYTVAVVENTKGPVIINCLGGWIFPQRQQS